MYSKYDMTIRIFHSFKMNLGDLFVRIYHKVFAFSPLVYAEICIICNVSLLRVTPQWKGLSMTPHENFCVVQTSCYVYIFSFTIYCHVTLDRNYANFHSHHNYWYFPFTLIFCNSWYLQFSYNLSQSDEWVISI